MTEPTPAGSDLSLALKEQMEYYRARAAEYDEWFLRKGRYDRGEEHTRKWFTEAEQVAGALESFAPYGDVLEFAGGTGLWTVRLATNADSVTVVDAAEEMIAINHQRVGNRSATYIHSDIFEFQPDKQYDFIFFGFWLSHVPSERFQEFWELVRRCLRPGGSFFFIDSIKEQQSTAVNHELPLEDSVETLVRKLNDGREFRIFKLFYYPQELQTKLESLGWTAKVEQTETFFLFGSGSIDA